MKNSVKKIISSLAAVLLFATLFCFSAIATFTEGNYTYKVENGEATIMKVSKDVTGAVTTPVTLGGYPVTAINGFAFDGCTGITKVTVSEGVKSLGYGTFNGCTNLSDIVLADTVTKVDYEVLREASSLVTFLPMLMLVIPQPEKQLPPAETKSL